MSKNFAVIGVGGYVAPRHLNAIKATGHKMIAALDINDSVGILDSISTNIDFFTESERFDRHLYKLKRKGEKVDYVSICSPNYLHDAHIRMALRNDANAICEKPLVLNPWNIDALREIEEETGRTINTILQLRHHHDVLKLKKEFSSNASQKKNDVELTYITVRGKWYLFSWKGDAEKSGGIATNIGIHFFDMLIWLFGEVVKSEVHLSEALKMSGYLELERARVKWFLSIDKNDLPFDHCEGKSMTYRSINVGGREVEFSGNFTDLHKVAYQEILKGIGFGLQSSKPAIQLAHDIRYALPLGCQDYSHDYLKNSWKK